jgi:hypothetical protein
MISTGYRLDANGDRSVTLYGANGRYGISPASARSTISTVHAN